MKPNPSSDDPGPAHEVEQEDPHQRPDGSNATIHHPDDDARQHPVNPDGKTRGPYVTGNS